eukprot:163997-Pyramimonas_sp.AAC.1
MAEFWILLDLARAILRCPSGPAPASTRSSMDRSRISASSCACDTKTMPSPAVAANCRACLAWDAPPSGGRGHAPGCDEFQTRTSLVVEISPTNTTARHEAA